MSSRQRAQEKKKWIAGQERQGGRAGVQTSSPPCLVKHAIKKGRPRPGEDTLAIVSDGGREVVLVGGVWRCGWW